MHLELCVIFMFYRGIYCCLVGRAAASCVNKQLPRSVVEGCTPRPGTMLRSCRCRELEGGKLGSAPPAKLLCALTNSLEKWNQWKNSKLPWNKLSKCDANFERFQSWVVLKWFFFLMLSFHCWPKISHLDNTALCGKDKAYHRTKHNFSGATEKWKRPYWSHCLLLQIQSTLLWPVLLLG